MNMKATGIIRSTDHLGRIVIPKELRRLYDIEFGTPFEIFVDGDNQIILKKYEPGCVLCGGFEELKLHKSGKRVCKECLDS